eukprot:7170728-Alexandrium_andersonii.AAC.1
MSASLVGSEMCIRDRFNVERSNVFDVFKQLCDSIGLLPSDYINVYHKAGDAYLVLWRKDDQRKVQFPSDFRF